MGYANHQMFYDIQDHFINFEERREGRLKDLFNGFSFFIDLVDKQKRRPTVNIVPVTLWCFKGNTYQRKTFELDFKEDSGVFVDGNEMVLNSWRMVPMKHLWKIFD